MHIRLYLDITLHHYFFSLFPCTRFALTCTTKLPHSLTHAQTYTAFSHEDLKEAVDECLKVSSDGDCSTGPYGPITEWDVSRVRDMHSMFAYETKFNVDLSKWDVSGVTDMTVMFIGASSFLHSLCSEAWVKSQAAKHYMFHRSPGSISTAVCRTFT